MRSRTSALAVSMRIGDADVRAAHRLAHREAVGARQHHVEHDRVVVLGESRARSAQSPSGATSTA